MTVLTALAVSGILFVGMVTGIAAWVTGYSYGIEDRFGIVERVERNRREAERRAN